jgi:hypothetical protein
MLKVWEIITPTFTAQLSIDQSEVVAAADHPLHDLVGMPWDEAREYCIDRGWHGDRYPAFIRGKSGLKRRGWTQRQIDFYLERPDDVVPNPHHDLGRPMGLYCIRQVEALERQWGICNGHKILETA